MILHGLAKHDSGDFQGGPLAAIGPDRIVTVLRRRSPTGAASTGSHVSLVDGNAMSREYMPSALEVRRNHERDRARFRPAALCAERPLV
jgi:hypothetical protein